LVVIIFEKRIRKEKLLKERQEETRLG